MLHWNVSEQNRVIQEQRRGGVFDDDSGDEASVGSEDEGEVVYDNDTFTPTAALARGRGSTGLRSVQRGGLAARGARPALGHAQRVNKPISKGSQSRRVVSEELQKALFDISHQLQKSSPAATSDRDREEGRWHTLNIKVDTAGSPSSPSLHPSTPPTESGSPPQRRRQEHSDQIQASASHVVSSQPSRSEVKSPQSNEEGSDDDIADFNEPPQQEASQRRPDEFSSLTSQPNLAWQRSVRGVKSWFGALKTNKAKPKLAGYKRAATQQPNLKSPAKSQRKALGSKKSALEPKKEGAPPQSWGRLREKQAQERKGKPTAEDDITDFSDDADDRNGASSSSQLLLLQQVQQSQPTANPRRVFSQSQVPARDSQLRPQLAQPAGDNSKLEGDQAGSSARASKQMSSFLKDLRGSSMTIAAKQGPPATRKSKRRGELSKKLERALQVQERAANQFMQSLTTDESLKEKLGQRSGLTVFVLREQFEVHLYVALAVVMGGSKSTTRDRLYIIWSGGTRKSLGISVGSAVHIFPPWSLHCLSTDGLGVMLCSDQCVVIPKSFFGHGAVDPSKDLTRVGNIELLIPQRLTEEKARISNRQPATPFFWQLPKTIVSRSQSSGSVSKLTKVASLTPWQANVSVKGRVLRSCPRSVLIANGSLDDAPLQKRFWMETVACSAEFQQSSSSEPCVWFSDDSGMMCKICTQSQVTEQWKELFLGWDGKMLELSGLSLRLTGAAELEDRQRHSQVAQDVVWKSMPVSKYELVVTGKTRRVHCETAVDSNLQPDSVRYEPVTLASLFDQVERTRVSVLVELLRMHALPSDGKDGTPFQTWLCVRDPSLQERNRQNVLVIVEDLNQMLSCADVLTEGDILLIKDVVVMFKSSPEAQRTGGITLAVDALSLVTCAVAAGKGSTHGVNGACGMLLPVTEVDPERLLQAKSGQSVRAGLRDGSEKHMDGWVSIKGRVADVSDLRVRKLCPVCRGESLTPINDEEEEESDEARVLICDDCEEVMAAPLTVFGPCMILLEARHGRLEVWLRGALAETLLGSARDDDTDWETELLRCAEGKHLRGEGAVVVNDQDEGAATTCWAVRIALTKDV